MLGQGPLLVFKTLYITFCLSHWRCPRLLSIRLSHCFPPVIIKLCAFCLPCPVLLQLCVFSRYIDLLSVWKMLHQGINICEEKPEAEARVSRRSTRLESHPSSRAEEESHLHSLSLAQRAVIGIYRRVRLHITATAL